MEAYRSRVERFTRENKQHVAISKLRNNEPITLAELQTFEQMLFDGAERGTISDFEKAYGEAPLGKFRRYQERSILILRSWHFYVYILFMITMIILGKI